MSHAPAGTIEQRMQAIEASVAEIKTMIAAIIPRSLVPGDELVWKHGKRPKFWGDHEVRGAVIALHRQMTIEAARRKLTEWFGAARVPSKSSLHRVWRLMDRQPRRRA